MCRCPREDSRSDALTFRDLESSTGSEHLTCARGRLPGRPEVFHRSERRLALRHEHRNQVALAVTELGDPERRIVVAREVRQPDNVERVHTPLRAEEVLAMSGRIQPAVQRDTRRAETSVCDVEVLAPTAEVTGLDGNVVRIPATRRMSEDLATGDRIAFETGRDRQNRRDLQRRDPSFRPREVDQADHCSCLLPERGVRIFGSRAGLVVRQVHLPRIMGGVEGRLAQRQLETGEDLQRAIMVDLMLRIRDLRGSPGVHYETDHHGGQHHRQRNERDVRAHITWRRLPVPVSVLDPHDRRIGSGLAYLYVRRPGP